jgi:biotin operon repressor
VTVLTAIKGWGPLPIAEIAALCSLSRRDVESAVEELRLAGEPIVGDGRGLHLTENPDELAAYLDARRRRMASIYLGNRALRRTVTRLRDAKAASEGLTLWDVA